MRIQSGSSQDKNLLNPMKSYPFSSDLDGVQRCHWVVSLDRQMHLYNSALRPGGGGGLTHGELCIVVTRWVAAGSSAVIRPPDLTNNVTYQVIRKLILRRPEYSSLLIHALKVHPLFWLFQHLRSIKIPPFFFLELISGLQF